MNEGKDATEVQIRVKKQREVIEKYPPLPSTLKALLHRLHGLPRWSVKPPLESISQEMEEKVVREFESLNLHHLLYEKRVATDRYSFFYFTFD
jgi:dihydrodipicolinate synthase/N-acetylneuraminate lyase